MVVSLGVAAAGNISVRIARHDHGCGEEAGVLESRARLFRGHAFFLAEFAYEIDILLKIGGFFDIDDFDAVKVDSVFSGELDDCICVADEDGFCIAGLHKLFSGFEVSRIITFRETDFFSERFRFRADLFQDIRHFSIPLFLCEKLEYSVL